MSCNNCNECKNSCTCPKAEVGERGFRGLQGIPGIDGIDGIDGQDGADSTVPGPPGTNGTNGTNGIDGIDGDNGINGIDGIDGDNGLSAYEIWINAGNAGSEQDFLDSLEGPQGPSGGGLTWITNEVSGAGPQVATLVNHGYVHFNNLGTSPETDYLLPLGAAVGDIVKVLVRAGRAAIECDASQLIVYGVGNNTTGGSFTQPLEFFCGEGESIQMTYIGGAPGQWIIENFQTSEFNPDLVLRIV